MVKSSNRKPRAAAPKDESKSEKFIRLANLRYSKTAKAIDNLSKLSGRGYEYTPEQVAKMRDALNAAVKSAMERFASAETKAVAASLL